MAELHVYRDERGLLVSRRRLGGRPVPHAWDGIAETTGRDGPGRAVPAVLVGVPVVVGGVVAALGAVEAGVVAGGLGVLAGSYAMPVLRRGLAGLRRGARERAARRGDVLVLGSAAEFDRVVGIADRISGMWPEWGSLIDPAEASGMLGEAVWGIVGLLARREELSGVLTGLVVGGVGSAAGGFSDRGSGGVVDETARELDAQARATKAALSEVEIELARREANLRRAEEAGLAFLRERRARQAISTAEGTLRAGSLAPATGDAGRELAEHTRLVLAAYRELTR